MDIYKSNELEKKVEKFKSEGLDNLHVVSDFDKTLTKCFLNGEKMISSFGLIRHENYLPQEYSNKAFELFNKFYPIEKDETLDYGYRYKKMEDWWKKHEKLLVESGFSKKIIDEIVEKHPRIFREGALQFFDLLSEHNIPLLIFSSGIGNLISGFLEREGKLKANVFIISNNFAFDKEGFATGYNGEIIHIMNKSESRIKGYDEIVEKNNVILLGDSLQDLKMVNNDKATIKIGFLNEDKEKLQVYRENFDVVITGDGSFESVNDLLREIIYT